MEGDGNSIGIADEAFEAVFNFFDQYEWTLDTRAIERADGREINPDVLGHIFEKYINQKQMGAYYTKEDITDYITKNTVIPWLFQNAAALDKVAFEPDGFVWRLLAENPNTYIFKSVSRGVDKPLPEKIEAGINDVSKRGDWNKTASPGFGLPTEIWRETVARRQRYQEVKAKIEAGEIIAIEDLITYNLDIRQFAQDIIQYAESPDVVRAFWKGISAIKVLDPACGSGAFLFAALGILFDLYDACLERMEQFVSTAPQTGGGRAQLYSDFRLVLEQVASHPNRQYFIYKSIIISNLYGVDIMDEAVEICKLRLFLKLAAQLESVDQIEPLPDIDFNIRAGNSLIGYTSFDDVRRATETTDFDFDDRAGKIEAAAQDLDKAFDLFRHQQTDLQGSIEADHKSELRKRLLDLGDQLDRFLAKDYGVDIGADLVSTAAFAEWRQSHKPFNWLIEFYGIVKDGGFDVIIGNPPYIENSKVRAEYQIKAGSFVTENLTNIYSCFIERAISLQSASKFQSMIVPVGLMGLEEAWPLRKVIQDMFEYAAFSSFGIRPAKLFDGVDQRLCIYTGRLGAKKLQACSTTYNHWAALERDILFDRLIFGDANVDLPGRRFLKSGSPIFTSVMDKLSKNSSEPIALFLRKRTKYVMHYHRSPRYWIRGIDFEPHFDGGGKTRSTHHFRDLFFDSLNKAKGITASINSTLFFIWYMTTGNGRNIAAPDVKNFPIGDLEKWEDDLSTAFDLLMKSYQENSVIKETKSSTFQEFRPSRSKVEIDDIDNILAKHFRFSEEEIDFILNYDIKYRVGASPDDEG